MNVSKRLNLVLGALFCVFFTSGCASVRSCPSPELTVAECADSDLFAVCPPEGLRESIPQQYLLNGEMFIPDFLLLIKNNSGTDPVHLLSENNSFGYYNTTLELDDDGKIYKLTKREIPWSRNLPGTDFIPPGGVLTRAVTVNEFIWNEYPTCPLRDKIVEMAEGKRAELEVKVRVTVRNGFVERDGKFVRLKPEYIRTKWTSVSFKTRRQGWLLDKEIIQ